MNVLIKEEVDVFDDIDDDFNSQQPNSQDIWSDADCQHGEKLLPFEFITLEPIEEEYKYVRKEYEEVYDLSEELKNEDKSSDLENSSPWEVLIPFKQVASNGENGQSIILENKLEAGGKARGKIILGATKQICQKGPQFFSLLRSDLSENSTTNPDDSVVLTKIDRKVTPSMSEFNVSLWEMAQILNRREQDRKRKALRRARETEEEKNLRRKKERLARAARRARESLEKKLIRRERDRKAKALRRAKGVEELKKLEKN